MYYNCSLSTKSLANLSSAHQLLMVGIFQNDVVSVGFPWAAADLMMVTLMGVVKAMAECHHHLHEIMSQCNTDELYMYTYCIIAFLNANY